MVARHGLTEVYAPPEGTATTALIIFVHGLFGHPYKTWDSKPPKSRSKSPRNRSPSHTKFPEQGGDRGRHSNHTQRDGGSRFEKTTEGTIFWPRDLLPSVIHDVRILTWGYDADVDGLGSASQSTITQHAGSLLSDIADQRDAAQHYKSPIVFVAHSLDGVIVKAALNTSSATEGTRLKDIAPATLGICFLGTPHRGSKSASLGKVAYQTTVAVTRRPNTKLLQGLERNSVELEQIGNGFAQTLLKYGQKMQIYSFREEKETRKWWLFNTMVVEADSAKIGDGREEVGSIPANHSDMAKFKSLSDVGFKRVVAQLRRWIQEMRANIDSAVIDDCMASLSTAETKIRISNVQKAHEMTFHWLYDPEVVSFSDWLRNGNERTQSLYWIQGKPGSGKSTLMKFAMRDPRTLELLGAESQPRWTFVAFFFHDRGSTIQKSLVGMLQEVVYSILRQLPKLFPYAITQYRQLVKAQRTTSPSWDLEALIAVMISIIEQRKIRIKLLLFIDALDEHEGDNDQLVQTISNWSQRTDGYYVTLKMCLASRSWNVFEHYFGQGPRFAIDQHTKDDIRIYTESRLNYSLEESPALLSPESFTSMTKQITEKAQGVFIWVRLVVDQMAKDIRDGTPYQMLEGKVAGLPDELKDLYDHTLRRIDPTYTVETHIMLQLVFCTLEPLPLETLIKATEYSLNTYVYGRPHDPRFNLSEESPNFNLRWLTSRSGGLLEIYVTKVEERADSGASHQYVQFLHQTAKEYVKSCRASHIMNRIASSVAEKTGFYFLTLSCESSSGWVAPIKSYMLHYAKLAEVQKQVDARIGQYGGWLARGVEGHSGPCDFAWWLEQQQEPFFKPHRSRFEDTQCSPLMFDYLQITIMVAANLIFLVDRISPAKIQDFFVVPETYKEICLLQVAIGGPDIVPAYLQDRAGMVQKLISLGYLTDHYANPRYCLKATGDEDPMDYSRGLTPMGFLLTGRGRAHYSEDTRIAIAKTLLDNGASVHKGFDLVSPDGSHLNFTKFLSYCAQYGSAAFVRLLLQYGAVLDERDELGWQPIDYALLRQDRAVLAAFDYVQSRNVGPDFNPGLDATDSIPKSLILPSLTVLASVGHSALAILSARAEGLGSFNELIRIRRPRTRGGGVGHQI